MKEKEQYCIMQKILNEKQWRLYLGTEAKKIGRGGISKVSKDFGANINTVSKGLKELESPFLGNYLGTKVLILQGFHF